MSVATAGSSNHVLGGVGIGADWRNAGAPGTEEAAMFEEDDEIEHHTKYAEEEDDEFDALQVKPSTLEVDYDKNLTELYQAITDQNWKRAASISRTDPIQAAIWVVRHYQDDDEDDENMAGTSSRNGRSTMDDEEEPEIMWRFLPLHSACARQPPVETIAALVKAYPDAAKCVDDQGMYALHYACGNQAEPAVIRLLLATFPRAAAISDPRGMLPLHYAACWGPATVSVIEALLKANGKAATTRDNDGNVPLDLAMDGDYPEKTAVAESLRKWIRNHKSSAYASSTLTKAAAAVSSKEKQKQQTVTAIDKASSNESKKKELTQQVSAMRMMIAHSNSSHGTDYNDAIVIDTEETKPTEKNDPTVTTSRTSKSSRRGMSSNISTASVSSSVIAAAAAAPTPRLSNNSTPPPPPETRQANTGGRSATPPPKARDAVLAIASPSQSIETIPSLSSMGLSPVKFSSALSTDGSRRNRAGIINTVSRVINNVGEILHVSDTATENASRSISNGNEVVTERSVETFDNSLVEGLQKKVQEQESELKAALEKLASVQRELTEKNTTLEIVERELESTKTQLETCESECNGLRGTLGDMMEQHESVKRKSGNTSDRLGTLSIGLESMMEQQSILTKTVKERNENYRTKFTQRQELFDKLLAMDKEVEDSEGKLDASLKKQTREMEAIAAVIKAALD